MTGSVNLWGKTYVAEVGPNEVYGSTSSIEVGLDGLYCHRPGRCWLYIAADLGPIESDTPDRLRDLERVEVSIVLEVVGSIRPIRLNAVLFSRFDRGQGPTLRVPLDSKVTTDGM
jgi:hypothetical protein